MPEPDWYVMVRRAIDSARASLRRLKYIKSGRIFDRTMVDLYKQVSILGKFLAAIGGPYFVTEIRRVLKDFRRDWEAFRMRTVPHKDLADTVNILISEVESSMEVSSCLPTQFLK